MNIQPKTREKVSISIDRNLINRIREMMKGFQIERMARGKKLTSLSRVMEAAITIGTRESEELEAAVIEGPA